MFKNLTRKDANKIINILDLSLLLISAVSLILAIICIALQSNTVMNVISIILSVIIIALAVLLVGFYISAKGIKDEVKTEPVVAPSANEASDMEEETIVLVENVDEEALAEAIAAPTLELSAIDFIDEEDEEDEEGVEVISVVWPERAHKNKIYRYSPNGEKFKVGDHVLVPTRDVASKKDLIRKATVAHGNHKMDADHLNYPLKNIIGIVKLKDHE